MHRRRFIALSIVTSLAFIGCAKPLSERVIGTWIFCNDDGSPRADGLTLTLSADGTGSLGEDGPLKWEQFPNMQYVTITFNDDTGSMTMRMSSEGSASLSIAGEKQPLKRLPEGKAKAP